MWSDADYGYGGAYGPSDQSTYAATDQYAQADNPWSEGNIQRDALTAGDNIPAMRNDGLASSYFGGAFGAIGRSAGTALGGGLGGAFGAGIGGYIGSQMGEPAKPEPPVENYGNNR